MASTKPNRTDPNDEAMRNAFFAARKYWAVLKAERALERAQEELDEALNVRVFDVPHYMEITGDGY